MRTSPPRQLSQNSLWQHRIEPPSQQHHNNITVYLDISVTSAITSDPFYDLHTTIAFMTEQQKAGYHIISEAEDVEDGKKAIRKFDLKDSTETIRKFLTENHDVESPSETHTFYFRDVPVPEEAKGILRTYPPEKIPGIMEFGVWYPESNFTIIRKRKTGPAEFTTRSTS
ncbi:hypothetical protein B0O99DRAFT_694309 [Bisporella sp. PMI_857]|nr:hypothetical protein B0O99DRAFT_694309 [Bisporella sp. PMI_857]